MPEPAPRSFVVKNGSNTRLRVSGSMPCPVSATSIRTYDLAVASGNLSRTAALVDRRGGEPQHAAARHRVPRVHEQVQQRLVELVRDRP